MPSVHRIGTALGEWGGKALVVLVTSALVIVGLLNGACSTTPPSGHCWRPGVCYEVSSASSCDGTESFSEHECSTILRVGTCVAPDGRRVYLYAPLHGLLPPDCERFAGAGAVFERD